MVYLFLLISLVPVVAMTAVIPYLTRKTESFGVTIPEAVFDTEKLKRMRKRYAWQTAAAGLVLILLWLFSTIWIAPENSVTFIIALALYLVISFAIYLIYHIRMKAMKAEEGWSEKRTGAVVADTAFRSKRVNIAAAWYLIPAGVAVLTFILSYVYYEQLPSRIPMQYDFEGNVTNWADKSYRAILMFPVIQLYMAGLFLFINGMIARSKQQIDSADPKSSAMRNQKFRRRWAIFNYLTGTAVVLIFSFAQLTFFVQINSTVQMLVPLVVTGLILIGALILSFTTGQGGSRINKGVGKQGEVIDRDDDRYWKLGQFYFNPEDPAIWLEKRFGIGWTLNFAHPAGWAILAVIILLAFILPFIFS